MPLLVIVFIRLFSTIHTRFFFVCYIVGKRTESNSILTTSSRRQNRNVLSWDRIGNLRHSFLGTSLPRINSITCYSQLSPWVECVWRWTQALNHVKVNKFPGHHPRWQRVSLSQRMLWRMLWLMWSHLNSLASERRPLWISTSTEDSTTSTRLLLVQTCESVLNWLQQKLNTSVASQRKSQWKIKLQSCRYAVQMLHHLSDCWSIYWAMGYCRPRTFPVSRGRVLPRCRLLCSGVRRQQCEVIRCSR